MNRSIHSEEIDQLRTQISGEVWAPGSPEFTEYTQLFSVYVSHAPLLVVRCRNASEVARTIKFCTRLGLSLSAKSGGFGTQAWSVAGQVVIDLSLINGVSVEAPSESRSRGYTSLGDDSAIGITAQNTQVPSTPSFANLFEQKLEHSLGGPPMQKRRGNFSNQGDTPQKAKTSGENSTTSSPRKESEPNGLVVPFRTGSARSFDSSASDSGGSGSRLNTSGGEDNLIGSTRREESGGSASGSGTTSSSTSNSRSNNSRTAAWRIRSDFSNTPPTEVGDGMTSVFFDDEDVSKQRSDADEDTEMVRNFGSTSSPGGTSEDDKTSSSENMGTSRQASSSNSGTQSPTASAQVTSEPLSASAQTPTSLPTAPALATAPIFSSSNSTSGSFTWINPNPLPWYSNQLAPVDTRQDLSRSTMMSSAITAVPSSAPLSNLYATNNSQHLPSLTTTPTSAMFSSHQSSDTIVLPAPLPSPTYTHVNLHGRSPPFVYVTFGAGAVTKQIDTVTSSSIHGPYHVPFSAFPVGTASCLTGGFGFLSRLHGLTIDNLVEAEVVMADGSIKWVNEESDPELWWALRGAGTCLCVATRYVAKAYKVPVVFSGYLIFPFHKSTAASLIRHWRDCMKSAPRELYANLIITAGPSQTETMVFMQICYLGERRYGAPYVEALSSWDQGPLFTDIQERSFLTQQDSVANVLRGGAGRKWYIRGDLLNTLTDEIISQSVDSFDTVPDGCTWLFELAGGALEDCTTNCFPTSHREAKFTIAALHQWAAENGHEEDAKCIATADTWMDTVIHPESPGGPIPSFMYGQAPDSYGVANWERIKEVKIKVDPNNVFCNSLWPKAYDELKGKRAVQA